MQLFKTSPSSLFICACLLVHAKAAPVSQDSSIHIDRRDLSFASLVPRAGAFAAGMFYPGKAKPAKTADGRVGATPPTGNAESTRPTADGKTKGGKWWSTNTGVAWWQQRKAKAKVNGAIDGEKARLGKLTDDQLQKEYGRHYKLADQYAAQHGRDPGQNWSAVHGNRANYHRDKLKKFGASGVHNPSAIEDHAVMAEIHDRKYKDTLNGVD